MLNISICDDSRYDIELLKKKIQEYSTKKHIQINITEFEKPEMLLYELTDGKIADIYFLDVSMPEKDGFELADEIRKYTSTSIIMFLTSHDEQAVCGYKAKALRYILKLNMERDIEEALDSAVSELSKEDENTITLHRYNDYWRVPYKEIISVTRISRQLNIETVSFGTLTDNRGITEFFDILNNDRFMFIDRSCFVNIDFISQINGYNLKLKNGQVLPISRRSLQNVKQKLLEYWEINN